MTRTLTPPVWHRLTCPCFCCRAVLQDLPHRCSVWSTGDRSGRPWSAGGPQATEISAGSEAAQPDDPERGPQRGGRTPALVDYTHRSSIRTVGAACPRRGRMHCLACCRAPTSSTRHMKCMQALQSGSHRLRFASERTVLSESVVDHHQGCIMHDAERPLTLWGESARIGYEAIHELRSLQHAAKATDR